MILSDIPAPSSRATLPESPRSIVHPPTAFDRLPGPLLAALMMAIYLSGAWLCLRMLVQPEKIAPIWPVNAIVIAILARLNRRRWHWALFGQALGCFAANLSESIPMASIFCYMGGNVLETLLAVMVLTRCGTERVDFSTLRHAFRLLVAAGPVTVLCAAIVAGANFYLAKPPHFLAVWRLWGAADGLGMLVIVPTLLSLRDRGQREESTLFATEVFCLLGGFTLVVVTLFGGHWPTGMIILNRPLLVTAPFLLWAALRTNVRVMCLASLILATAAFVGTELGRGPFVAAQPTVQKAIGLLHVTLMAWTGSGLVIAIAVSENRRTLDVVRHERERFRQITENIGEVFWMASVGIEQMMYISPAYEKIWGRSCQSLIANPKSFIDAIHPDDRDRVIQKLSTCNAGLPFTNEYRVVRPDGSIRWVIDRGFPVKDARGRITHYAGVALDVTERKAAQDYRELFRTLIDHSHDGILVIDPESGRILHANEKFCARLGYTRDEVASISVPDFNVAMDPRKYADYTRQLITTGPMIFETIHRRKDGTTFPVEVSVKHVRLDRDYLISVVRDTTDRIQMEELAIQSEKMLSIGGLAAGLAHEINNPLAIMMQNAEVMSNRISSDSPQNRAAAKRAGTSIQAIQAYMKDREIVEMLSGIHKSGERAASIVRNMLAFSQPSTAIMGLHRLDELIDQTVELTRSDYDLKKRYELGRFEIVREFDGSLPPVACHGSEMQQVLLNLFKNAVQASAARSGMDEGPRIVVRTRREKEYACIEVEDNGPGMPESVRRRVFEPFFTTKSPGEGTGLGLFVSYFIICQHHNGTMSVGPGAIGGTRFEITLPLKRTPATGHPVEG